MVATQNKEEKKKDDFYFLLVLNQNAFRQIYKQPQQRDNLCEKHTEIHNKFTRYCHCTKKPVRTCHQFTDIVAAGKTMIC